VDSNTKVISIDTTPKESVALSIAYLMKDITRADKHSHGNPFTQQLKKVIHTLQKSLMELDVINEYDMQKAQALLNRIERQHKRMEKTMKGVGQ
jgi:hypothetical protein